MANLLKTGARGEQVVSLQNKLQKLGFALNPDGVFGPKTVEAVEDMQQLFGYDADGVVGDATAKLIDAQVGYGFQVDAADAVKRGLAAQGKADTGSLRGAELKRPLKRGSSGADVRYLQRRLKAFGYKVEVDGAFGGDTESAVRQLQQAFGYDVDAVVGAATHHLIDQQLGYEWNVAKAAAAHGESPAATGPGR